MAAPNSSGKDSFFDSDSKNTSGQIEETRPPGESSRQEEASEEEDETPLNPDDLAEPHKFNWFKYLLDTQLQLEDEDGNKSALHSADSYVSLLHTVTSSKSNEEIQNELLDQVGYHNLPLLEQLLQRRDAIKAYCSTVREQLKARSMHAPHYKAPNMFGPQKGGVRWETGKGKKEKFNRNQYEKEKQSNYDLLRLLGFHELIDENKALGLKEYQVRRADYFL